MRFSQSAAADWYWIVGGSTTQVYSSARFIYVPQSDGAYGAWLAAGGVVTSIADMASLENVLVHNGVGYGLAAYANAKQWALATGGFTATIGGTPLTFPTDTISQGLIASKAVRLAQVNPPTTMNWQFASGFVALAAADFLGAAVKIADFVQATFDALKTVEAAIGAGTVTTMAQVDAAAWPAPHD